jgi:hypothetical protein
MSVNEFDRRVISASVAIARDLKGSPYWPGGEANSNHFVFDVITTAGGKVPGAASKGFTFVPGICGGSGLARGSKCSQ